MHKADFNRFFLHVSMRKIKIEIERQLISALNHIIRKKLVLLSWKIKSEYFLLDSKDHMLT